MSLNIWQEQIWCEVLYTKVVSPLLAPKLEVVGNKQNKWCKYHKFKGQHIDNCHQLKKVIERFTQEGHL